MNKKDKYLSFKSKIFVMKKNLSFDRNNNIKNQYNNKTD